MISKYNIDVLDKIVSMNCEAYLKNKGWIPAGKIETRARVFSNKNKNDNSIEIIVPLVELADYKSRICDILHTLQDFEDRDMNSIANEIVLSNYDVFKIAAFKGDTRASLPLSDAATLLDRAVTMIASAAQSIDKKQAYFPRRTSEVNDFLSKLEMGHTERGSFVISIQTPIVPNIMKEEGEKEELFARKVTTQLCSLITTAANFANILDDDTIKQSVSYGMNANFIEALADITNICGEMGTNLDMKWSPLRPCNEKNHFHIKRGTVDTLREIGKALKTKLPENDIEIEGYITDLHRDENPEARNIKIRTIDSAKLIHIDGLSSDNYTKALDAHKEDKIIVLKGDLQHTTKKTTLKNATILDIRTAID